MQIVIYPVDVWLFRDGKPFAAGEDHFAESLFPPSPFTLQGAIRTKVLVDKNINPEEFASKGQPDEDVGYGDNFGKLRLFGPLLVRRRDGKWERLVPVPSDVVKIESRFELLKPEPNLPFETNTPEGLKLLWAKTERRVLEGKGWLAEREWENYLKGEAPKQITSPDELFAFEPRFGIAIDSQKGTSEETMLYQARFVRLKEGTALWAEVKGVSMDGKGFLRLGGEGKAAVYERLDPPLQPINKFIVPPANSTRFKVVLLTPAWFSGGWKPKDGDWSKIFGQPVRLVGAALPRPLLFGGFDVAFKIPKPLRAFVSPGAVYFFEANEPLQLEGDWAFTETPDEIKQQNNGENAWAKIGLGVALIGTW